MRRYCFVVGFLLITLSLKATTFFVTNNNTTGAGSLAEAIATASWGAAPLPGSPHIIDFSTLPANQSTIVINDQLQVLQPMIVDGSTHSTGRITVSANGANIIPFNFFSVGIGPAASELINLSIVNSPANGIQMDGVNNILIENCYVGVAADGVTSSPVGNGIMVFNGANNITINNSIVSGNLYNGILMFGAATTNNVISNSKIGVDLSGNVALPNGANGVQINDGANLITIQNNVISSNGSNGFNLDNVQNVTLTNNKIGVGANGTTLLGNGSNGVLLTGGASDNTFQDNFIYSNKANGVHINGASTLNEFIGNTVSGNETNGFSIIGSGANKITNNKIGVTQAGNAALGNKVNGIEILNGSSFNEVVGNVISSNTLIGIRSEASTNTLIDQNIIGLGSNGETALGNGSHGVQLYNGANLSIVTNNVVSDNTRHGVSIENATGNRVEGNKIGTNESGTIAKGNEDNGVSVLYGADDNSIIDNLITASAFNGINLVQSSNNIVSGNTVGFNASGNPAMRNTYNGIFINDESNGNEFLENVIAQNGSNAVYVGTSNNNTFLGNIIGLGADGISDLPNDGNGIFIDQSNQNTIGGNTVGDRNLISNSGGEGITIESSSENWILGNFIGTDVSGTLPKTNSLNGISISGTLSFNNKIGDVTFLGRNVISANGLHGVMFRADAHDNSVYGNYIGTDSTGNASNGNGRNGVSGELAHNNIVGGVTENHRNVISGNGFNQYKLDEGPYFSGVSHYNSDGLQVLGNYIGLGADGETIMPNANYGVWYQESDDLIIANNVISGNGSLALNPEGNQLESPIEKSSRGVYVFDAVNVEIKGNYVGTNALGTLSKPNLSDGIAVINSENVTIGGTLATDANLVSGNAFSGIYVYGNDDLVIQGNILGLDASGANAVANGYDGLYLQEQSNVSVIENVISGNSQVGINIYNGSSNTVTNNTIGLSLNKSTMIGNTDGGIRIIGNTTSQSNSIISNIITGSTGVNTSTKGNGYGVYIAGSQGNQNRVSKNSIYCNASLAINLQLTGTSFGSANAGNDAKEVPVIDPATSTSLVTKGTGISGDTIQVYANPSQCGCGGEEYLGSTIVNPSGTWEFTHAATDSFWISVVAISSNGNTSQFTCKKAIAGEILPIVAECVNSETELKATGYSASELVWEISSVANFSVIDETVITSAILDTTSILFTPLFDVTYFARVISVVSPTEKDTSEVTSWKVLTPQPIGALEVVSTSICEGTSTLIGVENDVAGSYIWSDSTANHGWQVITGSAASISVQPNETTAYSVVATSGCVQASDTLIIEVTPLIVGSVTVFVNGNGSCEGSPIEFIANAINVGEGAIYTWTVDGNPMAINDSVFTSTTLTDGQVVQVAVTPDTTCPSQNSYSSNSITVDVVTMLSPTLTINGDVEICVGDDVSFTSTLVDPIVGVSYEWFINTIKTDSTRSSLEMSGLVEGDEIELVAYASGVCLPNDSVVSNKLKVTLSPLEGGALSISGDTEICEGEEVVFSSLYTESIGNGTFGWILNDVKLDSTRESLVMLGLEAGDNVRLILYPNGGCLPDSIQSNELTITTSPVVSSTLTIAGDTEICDGDEVSLSSLYSESSVGATYAWYLNNERLNSTSSTLLMPNLVVSDVVKSVIYPVGPCLADSVVDEVTITASSLIDGQYSITDNMQICEGDTINFTSSFSESVSNATYAWFVNGVKLDSSKSSLTMPLAIGDSVYSIIYPAVACVSDSVISDTTAIGASPTDAFTLEIGTYKKCLAEGESISVSAISNLPKNLLTYEWYINDVPQGVNDSVFMFVPAGLDTIIVGGTTSLKCAANDTANSTPVVLDYALEVSVDAGRDIVLNKKEGFDLVATGTSNIESYAWEQVVVDDNNKGVGFTEIVSIEMANPGTTTYIVTGANKYCSDTSTVNVTLDVDITIYKAFSPNEDGVNDRWVITNAESFPNIDIMVFNRWGTKLYHSQNGEYTRDTAWDGTYNGEDLPVATYYYMVDKNDGSEPISGPVTLIR